ncbi:hypothetical protein CPB83DRAFT_849529 [Crepidotus variabilis]|uniref:FHA domain-containing protein n=1 Tax=Crepidotus variabilis TaxID=179855 RepID=A0A9P6EK19_9AGAR|nr:hypothetical protein CPB83DRAFT_849529 [Crepidotus variabilis]
MDTSGFCQVGRYGTLSLLKRLSQDNDANGNGDNIITSFGIDDDELTFGSSTTCGVRLYYPDVESLHCKIVFENYKAFLAVLGASGVLVDGCKVYPHTSGGSSEQTIIPLSNMSEFEIHSKRFRFAYPPKEMRKALYATPARPPQKSLRLSMIHSAQVFSPRPSTDPRENLRVLQSPLKNPSRSPMKPRNPSPLKARTILEEDEELEDEDNEEEEDIVLVHTNHPRVVEEEKDLVILEAVPVQLLSPSKLSNEFPILPVASQNAQPKTPPRRRSLGGNALHRAVLIRSAQRAVRKAEVEAEDEEEEMEVLGVLDGVGVDDGGAGGNGVEEEERGDDVEGGQGEEAEKKDRSFDFEEDTDSDEDEEEEDDEEYVKNKNAQKSLWRKSIERILPWSRSDVNEDPDTSNDTNDTDDTEETEDTNEPDKQDQDQDESMESLESAENDENEEPLALPAPLPTPTRKTLGAFMTPGPHHPNTNGTAKDTTNGLPVRRNLFPQATIPPKDSQSQPAAGNSGAPGPGRFSLGGGEARRVVIEQPWRVRDLVVPMPPMPSTQSGDNLDSNGPSRGTTLGGIRAPTTPTTPLKGGPTPIRPKLTPSVSEEERRAIQERRRSAVKMLGSGLEWIPGMSPAKSSGVSSSSSSNAGLVSMTTATAMSSGVQEPRGEGDGRRSRSVSPVKQNGALRMGGFRPTSGSPTKGRPLAHAISEEDSFSYEGDGHTERENTNSAANQSTDDEMDTRGLLERMKETVEGMKRRRSVVLGTPQGKTPGTVPRTNAMMLETGNDQRREDEAVVVDQPLGSTKIGTVHGTPARSRSKSPLPPSATMERGRSKSPLPATQQSSRSRATTPPSSQAVDDHEEKEKPFSLLRPGAMEERRQTLTFAAQHAEDEAMDTVEDVDEGVPLMLPTVVVEDTAMSDVGDPLDEDEREQEVIQKTPKEATKSKAHKVAEQEQENENVEMDDEVPSTQVQQSTKPSSKTRSAAKTPTSRQKSRTPQPADVVEAEGEQEEEPETKIGPPRRARKASPASIGEDRDESQLEEPLIKEPAKRGRKPRSVTEDEPEREAEVEVEPTPAPVKRGRPKKIVTPPEASQSEGSSKPASRVKPPSKSTTVAAAKKPVSKTRAAATTKPVPTSRAKAATGRKMPSTQPEEDDDAEADPLDSYEEDDSDLPAPPARLTAAAKAKAKAATPATATKRKGASVKKEAEEEAPAKTPATRVGRSAKATAGSGKTTPATTTGGKVAKETPTATAAATKATRGRPKTPATAPAATTTNNAVAEKENQASGSGSGSGSAGSEEPDEASGAVKIRVSRSRGAAATAVATKKTPATTGAAKKVKNEEEPDDSAAPARTRATRVMRTRVKTG